MKRHGSLAVEAPDLASEWHPTKNGNLSPTDVSCMSDKKVWWLCAYDDPKTGKHFNFEWQATVGHRYSGVGCPYLSGKKVFAGFNDLNTHNPTLAKEWHPTKNKSMTPFNTSYHSGKKVWWYQKYYDKSIKKVFVFEWEATVDHRMNGEGCPYLAGKKILIGFNDFQSRHPELAKQWNYKRNKNLLPTQVSERSNKKVWWIYPYDDPVTGKHFDFEWCAVISSRVAKPNCPFISIHTLWPGYNDLGTLDPELSSQWDYHKNNGLTPYDVTASCNKSVWWIYPYDDPVTGKHFDFSWKAKVSDRSYSRGCPYLSGLKVWPGYNDLKTMDPEMAIEYDVEKNHIPLENVSLFSNRKVWWKCPYCKSTTYLSVAKRREKGICKCRR